MNTVISILRKCVIPCAFALAFFASTGSVDASGFKVLYSFCPRSTCRDGASPGSALIADGQGNLYGTTTQGGNIYDGTYQGTVFKLAPDGSESVLVAFCTKKNCNDGESPVAGLIMDNQGNLYGTTPMGGLQSCPPSGCGIVFKIAPNGQESVLYKFCSGVNCIDGSAPEAGLVEDAQGNLYGTTAVGGLMRCGDYDGCGTVFKLAPDGTETVLYNFCSKAGCSDGAMPLSGLIFDSQGNLYGTTSSGGTNGAVGCNSYGCGTVFKLAPDGTETVLHTFCSQLNCSDGYSPLAGLVADDRGNLYGTTEFGGAISTDTGTAGGGMVFKIAPDGTETVLYDFCSKVNCSDGLSPVAGLIRDSRGNLYGTTPGFGGDFPSGGNVFKLAPDGTETVLRQFCNSCRDGDEPSAGLMADGEGNLYGTTSGGGKYGYGIVFTLKP